MANHKSAIKRVRQNKKRYMRNKAYRTRLKNILKKSRMLIEAESDKETVEAQLKEAEKVIRKICSKGIIHKNKASRLISNLYQKAHRKFKQAQAS
ncbi:30S ribosomal protein S20 [Hippea maritima]|uniref:Small ribosomal subunit protein bS20 n=1 Tax=Hippea maritima (strain ATCC 700847 / DSM 10411 / MH2) TaxID=760142 RepID=F2LXA9_HIPMA|nr:30S ribosomal protein S20 [Hippea maritima]AEA34223.1 30S ribosomal protein S20 [Hippea maritima DSM 10411]